MTDVLRVPAPPIVAARRLPWLLGHPAVFMLDACLPPAFCTKVRSVAALVYHIARNTSLSAIADQREMPTAARLRQAFDGARLIAASTGSHARAVTEMAAWLRTNCACSVDVDILLTGDAPPAKCRALSERGANVRKGGDFTELTRKARELEAELISQGEKAIFLPTDPIDESSPSGLLRLSDGASGFATVLSDLAEGWRVRHEAGAIAQSGADTLVVPTSGGATWSACLLLSAASTSSTDGRLASVPSPAGIIAAGSAMARPVFSSLLNGRLETDYPVDASATGINGLDQRDMSPWAFEIAGGNVADPHRSVIHATCSSARIAQLIILAETGLLPEPAGAASLGAEIDAGIADAEFAGRLAVLLSAYGYRPDEIRNQIALDPTPAWPASRTEYLAGIMAQNPLRSALNVLSRHRQQGQATAYLVTGAWEEQFPQMASALVTSELADEGTSSTRLSDLLTVLAYATKKSTPQSVHAAGKKLRSARRAKRLVERALRHVSASEAEGLRLAWTHETLSRHGVLP